MGSSIRQCTLCGRLFNSLGRNICPACVTRIDECFELAREYLYNHPGADILELTTETGVDDKIILMLLREGRLSLGEASAILECEKCGKHIATGRYCKQCAKFLENTLSSVIPKKEEPKRQLETVETSPARSKADWNSHALNTR